MVYEFLCYGYAGVFVDSNDKNKSFEIYCR